MDASEMQELLQGYLSELDWAGGGVTKDDILRQLSGRDDTLRTMVNEYVAEGTYPDIAAVMSVLPAQAWQDAQGDAWRGAGGLLAEDIVTHYQESPAGQDAPGAYRSGDQAPPTPGFGTTQPEGGANGGASVTGAAGSGNAAGSPAAPMASSQAAGAPMAAGQAAGEGTAGGGAMGIAGGGGASDATGAEASVSVDVVVVGVDVDGDGTPDVVVADAIVYDETLGGGRSSTR
ncbi:MAG TPA: hypothetical protein VER37_06475 [Thermomicrobiales bacterium]|nr:hypothetical protein [Thermomicrobiales bacterium]